MNSPARSSSMGIEAALGSVPVEHWTTHQVIALDWSDGPREGLCELAVPQCVFYFHTISERTVDDDLDDRLFRIWGLPSGSMEVVLSALQDLGRPSSAVWAPVWRFSSPEAQRDAEAAIRMIEDRRQPSNVVLLTRDFRRFLGWWIVEQFDEGVDLFSRLGI